MPASVSAAVPSKLAPCQIKAAGKKNPKTLTKLETIQYKTVQQDDATITQGTTKQLQAGADGIRTITYTAGYKKGKLATCKHTGTKVTKTPVDSVLSIGTYVAPAPKPAPVPAPKPAVSTPISTTPTGCTNGTYVNTAGNTVCSPETSSSAPAGATAQCVDGTYSFSQSHSGTCSHHGGVASWL